MNPARDTPLPLGALVGIFIGLWRGDIDEEAVAQREQTRKSGSADERARADLHHTQCSRHSEKSARMASATALCDRRRGWQ
jgi:hypothetical protein